jgi:uncharacterized membrane protein YdjX (TVP38/TMEM64 family)
VIYNLAAVLFLPASVLTLGGGALYGLFWGSVYVLIAATLGATISFLIGRHFARNWVTQKLQGHPRFQSMDAAVARNGFKIVFLTRLSPIFPFNLLNYTFGVTCISLKDYVLGSIGMLPATIMYVYLGAIAGDIALLGMPQALSPQAQMARWGVKLVGIVATIAVMVYLSRMAKRSLNESIESTALNPEYHSKESL